jgi:sarcosine oxidase
MAALDRRVIIAGAGVMGSAVAWALARRGEAPVVLEQFQLNHARGSSHGRTRILRCLYSEGPEYVPWVRRAREEWGALEVERRRTLFEPVGGLLVGVRSSASIRGAVRAGRVHRMPFERLDAAEARERFPAFRLGADEVGLFDPQAGVLRAEACVSALAESARDAGAEFRFGERLLTWKSVPDGVELRSSTATYRCGQLVIAGGAWVGSLIPHLPFQPRIERQTVLWLKPQRNEGDFTPEKMPVFTWERPGERHFYGTPDLGDGVKVAGFGGTPVRSADRVPRRITARDRRPALDFARTAIPDAAGPIRSMSTCLFTYAPDGHFVLDRAPGAPAVLVVSPCSGHGFKFAPSIGEVAADLVLNTAPTLDPSPFRLARFRGARAAPSRGRRVR